MALVRFVTLSTLVASALLVAGCGDPTISTATEEDMEESMRLVKDSLAPERRKAFEEALQTLLLSDVTDLTDLADSEGIERRFHDRIDGKTAEEILSAASLAQREREKRAAQQKAEREERQRQQAISEIMELTEKLATERAEVLDRFVVERARLLLGEGSWLGGHGIELAVRNETESPIAAAHFRALVITPGRTIPWVDAPFSYEIAGGLEPGEAAEWRLQMNRYGPWADVPDDRHDMVLIVRPVQLDGPDGVSITGERIDRADETRLRALAESVEHESSDDVLLALDRRTQRFETWRDRAIIASVKVEIDDLRAAKDAADAARTAAAEFVVERSRFYLSDNDYRRQRVIDITIRNGTDTAVSRIYARGILSSPGRDTPWVDDTFNHSISGGIEPGETQQLKLVPNMFGDWAAAPDDRDDLVLVVEITRLDGMDGEALFSAEFDEEHAVRLATLEQLADASGR